MESGNKEEYERIVIDMMKEEEDII